MHVELTCCIFRKNAITGNSHPGASAEKLDTDIGGSSPSSAAGATSTSTSGRDSYRQPLPDIVRAKRLALAAARLVEVVSPRPNPNLLVVSEDKSRRMRRNTERVVEECELARMVTAFNIGMLSEVRH